MDKNFLLKRALDYGIVDVDTIRLQVADMNNSILQSHPHEVWKGENGYWYTYLDTEKGRKLTKRTRKEDLEEAIVRFALVGQDSPTFGRAFDEWSKEKLEYGAICKGTFDRYQNEFKKHLEPLREMYIEDIDEDFLEEYIKVIIKRNQLTAKAFSNVRTLIIGTFKYAKRKKYTKMSISEFFGDLEISKKSFTKVKKCKEKEVFSDSEVLRLIDYLISKNRVEHLGIALALFTGLREGELSALKYSDIVGNKAHIQRMEIKYKDSKGKSKHEIVDFTKTEAGDRYLFLPQKALEILDMIKVLNPSGEYVMMVGTRRVITNNWNWYLYKACDELKIPRRSMHKLRKTYGTLLIDNNTEDSVIKEQMGHSDIATTRKYYYYSNKNDEYIADKINDTFKGWSNQ